ncbi:TPA: DUF551 domain-containing protein [Escherichia coli]|uniref:DUF551 domain-containing protein n=2 Tax=Escherichia coli TaxID=562 RepID=UPI00176BAF21|nr:DUF551 domain-containing protein [Escherichia coli]MDJ2466817.1 DUF551 domain-containing protein [Salmonella enterica]EEX5066715.1 DUF551 domain-containing protein [Escherichia coli]MDU9541031.1 DUF551 domain-containing protein [Escherichia coli]HAG8439059.1 DUF551 domain-containing protein [Escherichia coli]HBE3656332.1 DUF551 domain-containing protein [Escherichia coli]
MTTFTDKELIKEIKERIGSLDVRDNIERRAYEIALASLEAEPVAWMRDDADGREYNARNEFSGGGGGVPLYATPPAPVVPEEKPMPNPLSMYAVDAVAAIAEVRGWNACRAAMLHGAEPVSQTYKLPPLSSNEVNDAAWKLRNMLTEHGHLNGRQFNNLKGCFYEALKVAMRNYPVTPDGWISCSERMPAQDDWILIYSKHGEYMAGQVQEEYVELSDGTLSWLGNALFWMPLPEPPQEAK